MPAKWPLNVSGTLRVRNTAASSQGQNSFGPLEFAGCEMPGDADITPLGGSDSPPQPNDALFETWKLLEPAMESSIAEA